MRNEVGEGLGCLTCSDSVLLAFGEGILYTNIADMQVLFGSNSQIVVEKVALLL